MRYTVIGFGAKPAVQNAMQRFQLINILFELTDRTDSPEQQGLSESDKVVPDSLADWLARPSQTITAEPQSEQGIFAGLMKECPVRVVENQAVPRGR
jgi:hypothetical protein